VRRANEYSNQAEALLEMLHLNREFNFLYSKEQLNTGAMRYCTAEHTQQARSNTTFYFANFEVEIDLRYVSYVLALKTLTSFYSGMWTYGWTSLS